MPDDSEQGGQEPDLELPKLFGRKKKKDAAADAVGDTAPDLPPARRLPPAPPPSASEPGPQPVPVPPEPTPDPTAPDPTAPEPTPVPAPGPTPGRVPPPRPVPAPDPVPAPEPQTDPVRIAGSDVEESATQQTTVLPAGPTATAVEEPPEATQPRKPKRERKPLALPGVNAYVAAVVTGLVCGLLAVVLEQGTQRGCESVRGVGSCGGIGLVALLVILAVTIFVGALLLRIFGVADPTSTSVLGVGIVAVLTLVFFLGSLESAWMFVVLPVLTAVSFAISNWVTAALVDVPSDEDQSTTVT